MKTKRTLVLISFLLLSISIAAGLFWRGEPAPLEFTDIKGISIISPPVSLPDINLKDHNGKRITLDDFKGHWSMAFFGYTHCPDVCPTSLAVMKRVATKLRKEGQERDTHYLFVSLDPFRDTPEVLKEYITFFDPDFIGITGDKTEIDKLSERVGVIYDYEGDVRDEDFIVNHYAAILIIDPDARLRAHILPPHSVEKVSTAFNRIRDYYGD